jgi:GntR family transcriptional regulator
VAPTRPTSAARPRGSLARWLTDELAAGLAQGRWTAGDRLPSEADIALEYGVSRVTVRSALQTLEARGLLTIRHGSGTFVADLGHGIRAGLQQLRSITETIRELGFEPHMSWHPIVEREADARERAKLDLPEGARVIALERAISADGEPVAYSIDALPLDRLTPAAATAISAGEGSVFRTLEDHGLLPEVAVAEVHAAHAPGLRWPEAPPEGDLYVLIDQVHSRRADPPILYSRSYFAEGRFQFVVRRMR